MRRVLRAVWGYLRDPNGERRGTDTPRAISRDGYRMDGVSGKPHSAQSTPPRSGGVPIRPYPPRIDEMTAYTPASGPTTPAPWGLDGPTGILTFKGNITPAAVKRIRAEWFALYGDGRVC